VVYIFESNYFLTDKRHQLTMEKCYKIESNFFLKKINGILFCGKNMFFCRCFGEKKFGIIKMATVRSKYLLKIDI